MNRKQSLTIVQGVESIAAVATTSSTNGLMSLEFSRSLSSGKRESEAKLGAKYAAMTLEDRAFEVLQDLGMVDIHEFSPDISLSKQEPPTCTKSVVSRGSACCKGSDEKDETVSTIGSVSIEGSATGKFRSFSSLLPKQNNARNQPAKKNLSQHDLSAKYAEMTLGDRAFEILKDLEMIEIHEFSPRKLSALQEEPGPVESHFRRFDEIQDREVFSAADAASAELLEKETPSKRQRLFRPLQMVFRKSRDKFFGTNPSHSVAIPPSLSKAVKKARQQPKSPSEEAILAQKYGQLAVEDRAFAILSDLGMIDSI